MPKRALLTKSQPARKSLRLRGISVSADGGIEGGSDALKPRVAKKARKSADGKPKGAPKPKKTRAQSGPKEPLPRTREEEIKELGASTVVIGIDEAGRGPLAGPVVSAAVIVPASVDGICDSKKLTKEEDRREVFDRLIQSPGIIWAAAVMDAPYIDKVNILQATLHGMSLAAQAVIHIHSKRSYNNDQPTPIIAPLPLSHVEAPISYHNRACSTLKGCYVVTNEIMLPTSEANRDGDSSLHCTSAVSDEKSTDYFALVDGNRLPSNMPCESETMTKGDGREYSIGAASIVAKVIRDNLMREYHELYPSYNLEQHKGYPTAAHMAIIREIGSITPIHRRTFNPLKTMEFDNDGKILS